MAAELIKQREGGLDVVLAHLAELERRSGDDDRWNLVTVTAAWLASRKSRHTRRAYEREIRAYFEWCNQTEVDPRDCRRGDIDAYAAVVGPYLSASSLARRISTVSSWYRYAQSNDVVDKNPAIGVERPALNPDASPTMGYLLRLLSFLTGEGGS